jgi:flavin reductase (DIM6/NTAB) family NADH-FMN oxidoreductase RutF
METIFHDFVSLEKIFRTNLINSFTGFKSLNLIGTESEDGNSNLAIFSQVIHVGANPPYIGVLFRPNTVPRHTLENIIDTGFFTVNHVNEKFLESAHQTSARWDISEFDAVNIEKEYKDGFYAPFVKESKIKAACELN